MTREEAINQLEINKKDDTYVIDDEALDMAIKALQESSCEDAVSRKDMYFKLTNGAYPNETIEQFIGRLVKELEDMPPATPAQRWIPVSERLPEKDVEVLATTEWGEVTIAMYCVTDWLIHEGDTNAETDEIVAWMPLLKPYQEEKKFCSDCKHHTDGEEIHGITPCGSCGVDKKNFE